MTEHQGLTVGQTYGHQRVTWLVFTDGGHGGAGRNRQIDALEFGATVDVEEQCLALVGNPHRHLVLLFQGDHQRLAGVLHPGWRNSLLGGQFGALEQGHDHIGQEEEDQGDGAEHGETANRHVPVCQAVLECAHAPLALQRRRIEIQSLRFQGGSHGFVGQIIHAHTLAVPYDKNMTMQ
ncbi:hypothetical protein D9M73_158280 [compost metagenome]